MKHKSSIKLFCLCLVYGLLNLGLSAQAFSEPTTTVKNSNSTSSKKLITLAEEYFNARLELNPIEGSATTGDPRYQDKLEILIAPEHKVKRQKLNAKVLMQLNKIDSTELSPLDQTTYALLKKEIQDDQALDEFPEELLPINQYGGLVVELAQYGSGQDIQQLKTVTQYRHYLKRLERLPVWVDQAIANMRKGIAMNLVQPKSLIISGLPAIEALTSIDLEKNPYYLAVKQMPESFSDKEKQQLTSAYKKVIEKKLIPANQKLVAFLKEEYLPSARTTAGIGSLPGGKDWYRLLVKYHTTTNMTPDEIHQLGLAEVARIHAEMQKIQRHYEFKGSLVEFLKWHEQSKNFKPFHSEQDVLDAFRKIDANISKQLPKLFNRIPKTPLEIRPEPELTRATAADHYNPPAIDGSRPGIYYAVILNPSDYHNTSMTSLMLHEGQPGHHFHIALQQELPLPSFRKFGWITAYGEGWALYTETLGKEMGLYEDKNQYLGHLKLELVRAVRLVTDTGLHAKGWAQAQTMQYMVETEGRSEQTALRITERYMAWPGQALAYKIGSLKIQELRNRAQNAFGEKFSLSEYHDLVLSEGSLPLSLLEEKVDKWIAERSK
jgi:uncharacterized protein (DUF885 family)